MCNYRHHITHTFYFIHPIFRPIILLHFQVDLEMGSCKWNLCINMRATFTEYSLLHISAFFLDFGQLHFHHEIIRTTGVWISIFPPCLKMLNRCHFQIFWEMKSQISHLLISTDFKIELFAVLPLWKGEQVVTTRKSKWSRSIPLSLALFNRRECMKRFNCVNTRGRF